MAAMQGPLPEGRGAGAGGAEVAVGVGGGGVSVGVAGVRMPHARAERRRVKEINQDLYPMGSSPQERETQGRYAAGWPCAIRFYLSH